jgi:elongation factor 3
LNNTKLSLKRNKFYGLLGPNNCGKTTMMRAIANEQVEGFPKRDELRTIFVEHEIQEREVGEDENRYPIMNIDLCGIEWVVDTCNNVYSMSPPVTKEQVTEIMEDIGFGNSARNFGKDRAADAMMGVTTYSGGWKMKMQLCAATLMNADILMLDEPTGHLDVKNIAWLEKFLTDFMTNGGSVICTSHDSTFLNRMCTHVIDFQDRKLKMFRGEAGSVLNDFVAKHPEKKGYFELKNDVVKFVFPKPGSLEGVKSKTKAIMKMAGVEFQYPTRDSPTVMDIGLQVSQVSRVAVIGPNGAGKSTAIKLLNGELKPSKGTIWQHPNMRLAYVAQHAFQHLEKHMTKTAAQYIMWRFAGNEDKESLEFATTELNDEDEKRQSVQWFLDPKQSYKLRKCEEKADEKLAVVPESILKRRENKKEKTKEYEVKWQFKPLESSSWVERDTLIKMGYVKMVQRKDEQEAAAAGLMTKPLTQQAIEKHLGDFGIEPEAASHTLLQALSGGQKVKVVLAASMWQNPHLVILDEPTNYLDRDGLGALTKAIEEYEGGVIIISHNREFANAVSQEKWIMEAGRLRREGESIAKEDENADTNVAPDDIIDASGNVIKVNKLKTLSDKEKKQELKNIEKKLREHKKKKNLDEEEYWELHDRQEELKAELGK